MITELKAFFPPNPSKIATVSIDGSKFAEILQKLGKLLAENDSEADDVFQENIDLIRTTLGTETFSKMNSAMQQFNFKKALEILTQMAKS